MNNDLQNITLHIGTLTLPMKVKREEESFYREAERLIKERYNFYATTYPNQKAETYFTMTALDIAVQAQRTKHSVDLEPMANRLELLIKDIEKAL
jgi:cell division protein ZapA